MFRGAKVAVFVDGCFWHACPLHGTWPKANGAWWREKLERNIRRDRATDAMLEENGWKIIRSWEHEDPREAAERIVEVVQSRLRDA